MRVIKLKMRLLVDSSFRISLWNKQQQFLRLLRYWSIIDSILLRIDLIHENGDFLDFFKRANSEPLLSLDETYSAKESARIRSSGTDYKARSEPKD